ncbi:MAG: hypothetical protein ACKOKA_02625, partial [Acidimicrobiaceae bacterium]
MTIDELPAEAAACTVTTSGSSPTFTVTINSGTACTYDLPAGVTKLDSYLLVGGGGGGGGGDGGSNSSRGGSGGRGGVLLTGSNLTTPSGATLTITVGSGGTGGAAD